MGHVLIALLLGLGIIFEIEVALRQALAALEDRGNHHLRIFGVLLRDQVKQSIHADIVQMGELGRQISLALHGVDAVEF